MDSLSNAHHDIPLATVIVQARMGSSRLPGKMAALLAGRPLIWHILQRAAAIGPDLPVVLATTTAPRDDQLAAVARELGLPTVRGSEDDVLGRFLLALDRHPARWVVRVCGDSPLFDPSFLNRCLSLAHQEDADVVKFAGGGPSLFQGGEVISARALRYTRQAAGDDSLAREHVTAWAMRHADDPAHGLRTAYLDPEPGMMRDGKLSIDTAPELATLQALYDELYREGELVDLRRAAAWLAAREGDHAP